MCFSSEASFTTAAVLTVVGTISLAKVRSKPYYMFACIPLIFALQQFIEGMLWSTFSNAGSALSQQNLAAAFLGIAFVVWPIWIPTSLFVLEKNWGVRKKILLLLTTYGVFASIAATYVLFSYPINFYVHGSSIAYSVAIAFPFSINYILLIYAIPAVSPFFASHHKSMWLLGCTIIGSLAATMYFKYQQLISVWCFFTALLSILILCIILWENRYSN